MVVPVMMPYEINSCPGNLPHQHKELSRCHHPYDAVITSGIIRQPLLVVLLLQQQRLLLFHTELRLVVVVGEGMIWIGLLQRGQPRTQPIGPMSIVPMTITNTRMMSRPVMVLTTIVIAFPLRRQQLLQLVLPLWLDELECTTIVIRTIGDRRHLPCVWGGLLNGSLPIHDVVVDCSGAAILFRYCMTLSINVDHGLRTRPVPMAQPRDIGWRVKNV